ncbi:Imm26 family immunity protein [Streptomyces sp. A30]|uniref:Imm26 family immunity protein n=1 Tax=Streptomyces sp. A30 TaxID=2789273 RepID=UPI00397F3FB5
MLGRYKKGDVLSVPVTDGKISLAQIVRELRGNVLLAVFPELLDADGSLDAASFELDEPIFLVETMDLRIKDGTWPVVGNREIPEHVPVPEYKVWVEPPGEYRIQDIHGKVGVSISREQASGMKLQKSFSPPVVEAALRGFHGFGPWRREFDELTL